MFLTCTLYSAWIHEETNGLAIVIDKIIDKAKVSKLTDNPKFFSNISTLPTAAHEMMINIEILSM